MSDRSDGDVAHHKRLKFAEGPRLNATTAHMEDKEAATVRYDDERGISEGDTLRLQTEAEEPFATAKVTAVEEVFAYQAFAKIQDHGACYVSASSEHLISKLNHHYDDTIWPSTRVKVIVFEVTGFAE